MPFPRRTVYKYVAKLREEMANGLDVNHLEFLKPLNIKTAWASLRSEKLSAALLSISELDNEALAELGIPLPYLASVVIVGGDREVHVFWHVPPGLEDTVLDAVCSWGDECDVGWRVPVQNCLGVRDTAYANELGDRLRFLLSLPEVRVKTPFLAYIIVSVMDKYRLITLNELSNMARVIRSRDLDEEASGALRAKYVRRYYRLLSLHNVIGRFFVPPPDLEKAGVSILIKADPECAQTIYGYAAATGCSAWIYVLKRNVIVSAVAYGAMFGGLLSLVRSCGASVSLRLRSWSFSFPFELYDPIHDRWSTEPVRFSVSELLRKLRLTLSEE
jgi:hypothetical protein